MLINVPSSFPTKVWQALHAEEAILLLCHPCSTDCHCLYMLCMSLHLADSFQSVYLPSMGTDRGHGTYLQVISDAVYNTAPSLRQAGMEFAVWVFKHGASEQLERAAPDILQGLWAQLEAGMLAKLILPAHQLHEHHFSFMSMCCLCVYTLK